MTQIVDSIGTASRMKNNRAVFAKASEGGKEIWTMLIEKAYAKHFGKGEYGNIEGGNSATTMEKFTGIKSSFYKLKDMKIEELAALQKKGHALSASSLRDDEFL